MTSQGLCECCSLFDLDILGYHEPPPSGHQRAHFYYKGKYQDLRKVDDVLRESSSCVLCNAVSGFYHRLSSLRPRLVLEPKDDVVGVNLKSSESLETDVEGKPRAEYLRLCFFFSLENASLDEDESPELVFLRTSANPCKVSDFVHSGLKSTRNSSVPYEGRLRPQVVDLGLLCTWMDICIKDHQACCDKIVGNSNSFLIRLIDVGKRNVRFVEPGISYAALSYVWGQSVTPWLKQENADDMQAEGSLAKDALPATIEDAMVMTAGLGLRYLWVDSCCIIQDDPQDQLRFIPEMGSIYEQAAVTLVAASGFNAQAGLPGIGHGSRTNEQVALCVNGVYILESLDPVIVAPRQQSYLGQSVWNQRAWTYQERLLSRRVLVFTDKQIFWECRKASWCEDIHAESFSSATMYSHSLDYGDVLHASKLVQNPWGGQANFEVLYPYLVEAYSSRSLTKASDYGNAFNGILSHLEKVYGMPFFWALPEAFFSTALCWPAEYSEEEPSTCRRIAKQQLKEENCTIVDSNFPSWSWLGWSGSIRFSHLRELRPNSLGLKYYRLSECRRILPIRDTIKLDPNEGEREWRGTEFEIVNDSISSTLLDNPLNHRSLIIFWSSVAPLTMNSYSRPGSPREGVAGSDDVWFRVEVKHLPSASSQVSDRYEGIVVGNADTAGRGTVTGGPSEPYGRLHVVLARWENGVAYRHGLISLSESDWTGIRSRQWKLVVLG
ncbi:MAG: hypothetical protein Q9167_002568 [Letrouitia subvulpina]